MARKSTKDAAAKPSKPMLYVGPEGMLYDGGDKPVAILEPGLGNAELVLRIVESVNALSGYSLDEIRRGAFHGGVNLTCNSGFNYQNGSGNHAESMS